MVVLNQKGSVGLPMYLCSHFLPLGVGKEQTKTSILHCLASLPEISVQCMHKLWGFWWGFFLTLDFQVPVPFPDLKEEVNNSANETTSTEFLEFAKMNYLRYSK